MCSHTSNILSYQNLSNNKNKKNLSPKLQIFIIYIIMVPLLNCNLNNHRNHLKNIAMIGDGMAVFLLKQRLP
jgi:hypothetical protein